MSEAVFSLAEAARRCGVSRSRLQRNIEALEQAGAIRNKEGWRIPVSALISLGFMPRTSPPDLKEQADAHTRLTPNVTTSMSEIEIDSAREIDELKRRLAEAEKRAAVAEAVAAERERIITTQQSALRLLETGQISTRYEEKHNSSPHRPFFRRWKKEQ